MFMAHASSYSSNDHDGAGWNRQLQLEPNLAVARMWKHHRHKACVRSICELSSLMERSMSIEHP